ncbi:hypothetical protein NW755_002366 [Fusarium falciforme]|uniref:Uncharacterized protein n=1 Tax=Fusarium falciforme TaxID=195108 RepID=A0A9W8REC3_9HYPO|nr:hypothetical protein NW755_002366 [Fusarium falciforme]
MSRSKLSEVVEAGDDIFLLDTNVRAPIYLILRKTANPREFRLIAVCPQLGLLFLTASAESGHSSEALPLDEHKQKFKSWRGFQELYLESINPKFQPRVSNGFCELSLDAEDEEEISNLVDYLADGVMELNGWTKEPARGQSCAKARHEIHQTGAENHGFWLEVLRWFEPGGVAGQSGG